MKVKLVAGLTLVFVQISFASSDQCSNEYFLKKAPQGSVGVIDLCLPEVNFTVLSKPEGGCPYEMIEAGPKNSLCRPRIFDYTLSVRPENDKCPEGYFRKRPPTGSTGVKDACLPEIHFGIFKKTQGQCGFEMIETGPQNQFCRPRIFDYSLARLPESKGQSSRDDLSKCKSKLRSVEEALSQRNTAVNSSMNKRVLEDIRNYLDPHPDSAAAGAAK